MKARLVLTSAFLSTASAAAGVAFAVGMLTADFAISISGDLSGRRENRCMWNGGLDGIIEPSEWRAGARW